MDERKLHTDMHVNWVEALPRVLRIHNDTPNETGYSPYQILFGRDRNEAGIPYEIPNECEGAKTFLIAYLSWMKQFLIYTRKYTERQNDNTIRIKRT